MFFFSAAFWGINLRVGAGVALERRFFYFGDGTFCEGVKGAVADLYIYERG